MEGGGSAAGGIFGFLIALALMVLMIASMWKIYTKAGEPGWAAIIPIYNVLILLKIVGKPGWWIVLFFIPFVNFVVAILVYLSLANAFGKGAGYALGLMFLSIIFFPLLAFSDARYVGPTQGYVTASA